MVWYHNISRRWVRLSHDLLFMLPAVKDGWNWGAWGWLLLLLLLLLHCKLGGGRQKGGGPLCEEGETRAMFVTGWTGLKCWTPFALISIRRAVVGTYAHLHTCTVSTSVTTISFSASGTRTATGVSNSYHL